jgi:hypothetical protein
VRMMRLELRDLSFRPTVEAVRLSVRPKTS